MLTQLIEKIQKNKDELDRLRPLRGEALAAFQQHYDVDLTYTSNAIEGNTLTLRETAEVIEHGITVGGKSLSDHLEAVDHYDAVLWMRNLAGQHIPLTESVVCELHRRIVARSQPDIAGVYSRQPRRIAGSRVVFPNPVKIPDLMAAFGTALQIAPASPEHAFDAHYKLTAIHPFLDGNGRTARLLMNLLLVRGGYPQVPIRPQDRAAYLDSLETASTTNDLEPYRQIMYDRLDATLGEYLGVLSEALPIPPQNRPGKSQSKKPDV